MSKIVVRSPAKLNLTFDISGVRPDGFHEVETIMQSITLEDELAVTCDEASVNELSIECDNVVIKRLIPLDDSNLISKAAKEYVDYVKPQKHYKIKVHLEKKIPVGAGLAGGSSNAAAMLVAMNQIYGNKLSTDELMNIAAKIGSDVSFCLRGGTCIGRGRGEILEKIDCNIEFSYCIVKPRKLSVSTPLAYKSFDEFHGDLPRPEIDLTRQGLVSGDIQKCLDGFANVFEPVIFQKHPELAKLKEDLLTEGAWACQMTGSGPTLFAVVAGREMGHHIRRHMLRDDDIGFVYGTEEIILEALPPIDFRLAESSRFGARIVSA